MQKRNWPEVDMESQVQTVQNILRKIKKSSKLDKMKNFDVFSCVFERQCQKFISAEETGRQTVSPWILGDFPVISLYPKILSLMLFGNSLGNLYIELFILDIKLRSTYGEWKLY